MAEIYTRAELVAQLAEVQAAITKVLSAQSYSTGVGSSSERAQYRDLCAERRRLKAEIAEKDAAGSGDDSVGPLFTKAKFQRQT